MTLRMTALEGCFEVQCTSRPDDRGTFLKIFHDQAFQSLGLCTSWAEEFITSSRRGVLRGMHFQAPPRQHAKLVTCLCGRVLDVVLDLRAGSATYGKTHSVELSWNSARSLYIPEGLAHGFLALEEGAMVHYKVSTIHSPEQDHGILWNSFGFAWPEGNPILSQRDRALPPLDAFRTPFRR